MDRFVMHLTGLSHFSDSHSLLSRLLQMTYVFLKHSNVVYVYAGKALFVSPAKHSSTLGSLCLASVCRSVR